MKKLMTGIIKYIQSKNILFTQHRIYYYDKEKLKQTLIEKIDRYTYENTDYIHRMIHLIIRSYHIDEYLLYVYHPIIKDLDHGYCFFIIHKKNGDYFIQPYDMIITPTKKLQLTEMILKPNQTLELLEKYPNEFQHLEKHNHVTH